MEDLFLSKWSAFCSKKSLVQELVTELSLEKKVRVFVKRDDLIDPFIMGNKWRKLKYNLWAAHDQGFKNILTFGGAHSNHILATAAAGQYFGFNTIGIIRGEELSSESNKTLSRAHSFGMKLHFISREQYKKRDLSTFAEELRLEFGNFYLIPEGGSNELALKGCAEVVEELPRRYDYYCCACGTGSTAAGFAISLSAKSKLIVFPALNQIEQQKDLVLQQNNELSVVFNKDYVFGGYAKSGENLVTFINDFSIPLDSIYTSKLFYGVYDLLKNDFFPANSSVLIYHSGGYR